MSTYSTRTPPTTNYSARTPIVSYDWITWNESTDTWNSVTETWDTYYSGVIEGTQYSVRQVIS